MASISKELIPMGLAIFILGFLAIEDCCFFSYNSASFSFNFLAYAFVFYM